MGFHRAEDDRHLRRGLRQVERTAPALVPWAWAVNGAGSVLGPVLAMVIAIERGFVVALLVGAGLYVVAAVLVATGFERASGRGVDG